MPTLEQAPWTDERGATVAFTDTASDFIAPDGASPIFDFDAVLTHKARNGGGIRDAEYPIGLWPATANYAGVLLASLTIEQSRILDVYENSGKADVPDARRIRSELGSLLVGVLNSAPRNKAHVNGAAFYLAELDEEVVGRRIQIFSQLEFLKGVAAFGFLSRLWEVPNHDNPVWPEGEQYRSSIVTHLRNFPESLVPVNKNAIEVSDVMHLAYADKYGNCRIWVPAGYELPEIESGVEMKMFVDGKEVIVVGADTLIDIPQGCLGIYTNPADVEMGDGFPRYLELARRVPNPNKTARSAYAAMKSKVNGGSVEHPVWPHIQVELFS